METFDALLNGFAVALTPENLLFCTLGVLLGTLVGALPGIGPIGAIAMLLAATYSLGPTSAIVMLAGIYYGTQYGGTITAVMMGVPGESSSVVTTLDGFELAKLGKAGTALGIASIGSFVGGTISVIALSFIGPKLAGFALQFGAAEYFSLLILAFALVTTFASQSIVRGLLALCLGLAVGLVGMDVVTGTTRFTFGEASLLEGINFLPLGVGLFGLGEIISNFESNKQVQIIKTDVSWRKVMPSKADVKESTMPIVRGSFIGFFAGLLPGVGASLASFLSYGVEKLVSKKPEEFGRGSLAGLAGPETANNALTGAAFIPMLSLGIPAGATSAVLLGALLMFGISPGPSLFQDHPDVVWGLIASMYIGNVLLVIINMSFIPAVVWVMDKVKPYLSMLVLFLATYGVYSFRGSVTDIAIMVIAGGAGYLLRKMDFPLAPIILGVLLGGMTEHKARMALGLSDGHVSGLVTGPMTITFYVLSIIVIALGLLTMRGKGNVLRSEDNET